MTEIKPRILIVDDEQAIRRFLHVALESQKYAVFEAASGQAAITDTVANKPDLLILDLGLPDMDGVEVVRLLRQWTQVPIIILSVRGSEMDKIEALDAGADDYLTKPFGMGELIARVAAALRRGAKPADSPIFVSGNLKVDLAKRIVMVGVREVQLTPNEYELLRVLVLHSGKVLTQRQLLREVWGETYGDELHMLHVNISNLRRKIEAEPSHPHLIITEPGVGYRLRAD
ncbi:MAG TPA: response regulator [Dehalococcoidia bacterium]|nr:response regulator [Dehalococcoidia bacterium]